MSPTTATSARTQGGHHRRAVRHDTVAGAAVAPVGGAVPFIRASQEHREGIGLDISRQMTVADQDLGVFDVPAVGYMRALVLVITTTGGVASAAPGYTENAPWNAIKNVALTEPNGANIYAVNDGYQVMLTNKFGGYRGFNDPRQSPVFSAVNSVAPSFSYIVRIPVELNARDALGSLPNQNSAATFKLRLTLARLADVFATPGNVTTAPTVRVRGYIEAWDQPEAASAGAANQITPPALNTTQFWSVQSYNVAAGAQQVRITRVGNFVRNLIFILNRIAGTRAQGDTDMPDPLTVYLDTRPLDIVERNSSKHQMFERYGYGGAVGATIPAADTPGGLENGVFAYDFCHEFDGVVGHENRDLWLPTLSSSRLELQGSFANAGTLTVLVNDVAIAGDVFLG